MDKETREKMNRLVFDPPPSLSVTAMAELPEWQPDAMANSFMATMASRGQRAS